MRNHRNTSLSLQQETQDRQNQETNKLVSFRGQGGRSREDKIWGQHFPNYNHKTQVMHERSIWDFNYIYTLEFPARGGNLGQNGKQILTFIMAFGSRGAGNPGSLLDVIQDWAME